MARRDRLLSLVLLYSVFALGVSLVSFVVALDDQNRSVSRNTDFSDAAEELATRFGLGVHPFPNHPDVRCTIDIQAALGRFQVVTTHNVSTHSRLVVGSKQMTVSLRYELDGVSMPPVEGSESAPPTLSLNHDPVVLPAYHDGKRRTLRAVLVTEPADDELSELVVELVFPIMRDDLFVNQARVTPVHHRCMSMIEVHTDDGGWLPAGGNSRLLLSPTSLFTATPYLSVRWDRSENCKRNFRPLDYIVKLYIVSDSDRGRDRSSSIGSTKILLGTTAFTDRSYSVARFDLLREADDYMSTLRYLEDYTLHFTVDYQGDDDTSVDLDNDNVDVGASTVAGVLVPIRISSARDPASHYLATLSLPGPALTVFMPLTGAFVIMNVWDHVLDGEYNTDMLQPPSAPHVIVDIGANVGAFSIHAARKFPNAQIHAFEPNPLNFGILQRNILINKLEQQVRLYNMAIRSDGNAVEIVGNECFGQSRAVTAAANSGSRIARGALNTPQLADAQSWMTLTLTDATSVAPSEMTAGTVTIVPSATLSQLDDFIGNPSKIDYMKIDCECCEYDLVRDIVSAGYHHKVATFNGEVHLSCRGENQSDSDLGGQAVTDILSKFVVGERIPYQSTHMIVNE